MEHARVDSPGRLAAVPPAGRAIHGKYTRLLIIGGREAGFRALPVRLPQIGHFLSTAIPLCVRLWYDAAEWAAESLYFQLFRAQAGHGRLVFDVLLGTSGRVQRLRHLICSALRSFGGGEQAMRHDQRGFSLIELLIVVAIILIIAAIAIPNLLRSRVAANQASAIESLRVISTAEVTYATTYGTGFSTSLAVLGPPASGQAVSATAAGLVDDTLAAGYKSGYTFTYTANHITPPRTPGMDSPCSGILRPTARRADCTTSRTRVL